MNGRNSLLTDKDARLLLSELQAQMGQTRREIDGLQSQISSIPVNTTPTQNPSGVVNQIRNGNHSHSVYTWTTTGSGTNAEYEDAWWYSHPIVDGQPMYLNTTATSTIDITLSTVDAGTDIVTIVQPAAPDGPITLETGTAVKVTGSRPAPLALATVYYLIVVDSTHVQFAATYADALSNNPIDLTTTTTGGTFNFNYTLKVSTNTQYSAAYSDWDWTTGSARFQGATDISAPLPGDNVEPGYTYYAVGSFVRKNQYVTGDPSIRLFAGLYANSTALGGWDWVYGDFDIDLEIIVPTGYVYVGGVTLNYQIHCVTNRDFTVNSSIATTANGPTSADFTAGCRVLLTWKKVLNFGVNSYNVYRTGPANDRLFNVVNGTTYIDNNSVQENPATIPAADYSKLIAYTSTSAGIIDQLPYQGDPLEPIWAVVPFAIKVPQNFDMADIVLADKFWLRYGFANLSTNLDLHMTDGITSSGSNVIQTASSGQFSTTDPNMVGLTCDVYATQGGSLVVSGLITAVNSANEIELDSNAGSTKTGAYIYIHEGAPSHALYVDLNHLGWVSGAAYAPNGDDINRTLPPPVTPNGTTQGGNGGGQPPNTPDGQPVCLFPEELVTLHDGTKVMAGELKRGDKVLDPFGGWNTCVETQDGVSELWLVTTDNGAELVATPTKQVYTSSTSKKRLANLGVGDTILTGANGVQPVESTIIAKTRIKDRAIVRQISLAPRHSFLAGSREMQVVVDNRKTGDIIITV